MMSMELVIPILDDDIFEPTKALTATIVHTDPPVTIDPASATFNLVVTDDDGMKTT
jgi:hypothetical protein